MELIRKTFNSVSHIELRERGMDLIYYLITKSKSEALDGWNVLSNEIHSKTCSFKIHSDLDKGKVIISITDKFGDRSEFVYKLNEPTEPIPDKEFRIYTSTRITLAEDESNPVSLGEEINIIFNPNLDDSVNFD